MMHWLEKSLTLFSRFPRIRKYWLWFIRFLLAVGFRTHLIPKIHRHILGHLHSLLRSLLGSETRKFDKAMTIETVSICNASCSFCPYPILEFPKKVMSDSLFENALSLAKKAQVEMVDFTPYLGEAFIDPQLISRIRKTRKELPDTYIWLVSNGTLLTRCNLDDLLTSGLSRINISFGVWGKEDYLKLYNIDAWDKVYEGIRALLTAKERLKSNVFVALWYRAIDFDLVRNHPENIAFLKQYGPLINKIEYSDVYHDILAISGQQPKTIKLETHLNTYPLMAASPCIHLGKLAATPTGNWYACYCSISDSYKQDKSWFYLGSANTPDLNLNDQLLRKMDDWTKGNIPDCCRFCPAYIPMSKGNDPITYNFN